MVDKMPEGLEFSYESTATASYLTVNTGLRGDILDYQVSMAAANCIGRMAHFNMKCSDGNTYFYYNITSMLSLSFFLKRRKLGRDEFVSLLSDIARTLVDCEGYLLSGSSFVLDVEYMFINPETLDISMIYLPVERNRDVPLMFKEFVIGLILKYAEIDENSRDNFLQKILAAVKNDLFNLPEFLKLLDSLLFKVEAAHGISDNKANSEESKGAGIAIEAASGGGSRETKGFYAMPVVIAILWQLLISIAAFICVKYFKNSGNNSTANYAAIGIIALAADVFLFKNFFRGKGLSIRKPEREGRDAENSRLKDWAISDASGILMSSAANGRLDATEVSTVSKDREDKPEVEPEVKLDVKHIGAFSNNTVLLGNMKKGLPVLKSKTGQVFEDIVIDKPDFIIGRLDGQVDHVCRSNAVGKVHAQIINDGDTCLLKDLNSINGTFVNNIRIPSNVEHELKDGDNVVFANCEYVLSL